jgi:amino-acid N-acetyltransferase
MLSRAPTVADVDIRPARPADFAAAASLLQAAGLPVTDLSADRLDDFLVATSGKYVVGLIGLEARADIGLLRSLVAHPDARERGLGRRLVAEVEALARRRRIAELWLLTIDARRYFENRGYTVADRAVAPEAIRRTAEFTTLCPGDAVLMKKSL